jgi:hypothetical protein
VRNFRVGERRGRSQSHRYPAVGERVGESADLVDMALRWMICFAILWLSGCVEEGGWTGGEGTVVSLHAIHDDNDATMDDTLEVLMRSRPTSGLPATDETLATSGDVAGGGLLDPSAAGASAARQGCALDDEGHALCCGASAEGWCCVHDGPDGSLRVCI